MLFETLERIAIADCLDLHTLTEVIVAGGRNVDSALTERTTFPYLPTFVKRPFGYRAKPPFTGRDACT
jgi:hypothetical protein